MPAIIEAPLIRDLEIAEPQPANAEIERQPESVVKLLLERVERGYRRGIDDDGHKIGIAFDAGGLAGVVSAAMAEKMSVLDILNVVDAFYGLSAGTFNALFAASGELPRGIKIYTDVGPNRGLIQKGKAIPPKLPVMDQEVLRDALYNTYSVNVKKIIDQRIPVVMGATDLSDPFSRKAILRSTDVDPNHPEELVEMALAGGHIPVVSGEPITLKNGHTYTDATMTWSSTIELAQADGCTDVLSLANSPEPEKTGSRKAKAGEFMAGWIGDKYLDKRSPRVPSLFPVSLKEWLRRPIYSTERAILHYIGEDPSYWDIKTYKDTLARKAQSASLFTESLFIDKGVNVERVYPPEIPNLPELLTTDKKKMLTGIRAGRLAVRKTLQNLPQSA